MRLNMDFSVISVKDFPERKLYQISGVLVILVNSRENYIERIAIYISEIYSQHHLLAE